MKGRLRIDFESLLPLITLIILGLFVNQIYSAPAVDDEEVDGGCYYMFNHYGEGDRILTNEPCLNCTCHNSMLMCYLRVCPFTKPIGQDCTIEKKPDQCCPVISCPEEDVRIHTDLKKLLVPVSLVTPSAPSSTTQATTSLATVPDSSTDLAMFERGCEMNGKYYSDGAQVEGDPSKPCELCYCIRNQTACVMQECILHVEGCEPVFQPGVCCPVRYRCDYPPQITDSSTIASVITTTISSIFQTTPQPGGCYRGGEYYADGSQIPGAEPSPCEHCYCMRGEIVCAVQECGTPLENAPGNCTAVPPPPGHCCPEKYTCGDTEEISADEPATSTPISIVSDDSAPSSSDGVTSSPSETADHTELEPAKETTVSSVHVGQGQEDSPAPSEDGEGQNDDAQTVPPTVASASEKVDTVVSTSSPLPDGDEAGVVANETNVQTPTEASIPVTVMPTESQPSQDQPEEPVEADRERPTEPSPVATDAPVSQDDSSSSPVTEVSPSSSSPSSEPSDETIFGTTVEPEAIPSENLQLPSSPQPSQDEPSQIVTTTPAASVSPGEPDSDTESPIEDDPTGDIKTEAPAPAPTSAKPPSVTETVDDEVPVEVTTTAPVSSSESSHSSTEKEIESDAVPVPTESATITPTEAPAQGDDAAGVTSAPLFPPTESSDQQPPVPTEPSLDDDSESNVPATTVPSQTGVSSDDTQTSSEAPLDNTDTSATTQAPSQDGQQPSEIVSDDQSATTSPDVPTTSRPVPDESSSTQTSPSHDDSNIDVTTQQPIVSASTEQTAASSEASVVNADDSTTVTPDMIDTEKIVDDDTHDGGEIVSPTTIQPVHDDPKDVVPVETVSEQPTTVQPTQDDASLSDNEISNDPAEKVPVTSEEPMMESSTENVVVSQPSEGQQDQAPSVTELPEPVPQPTTVRDPAVADDEAPTSLPDIEVSTSQPAADSPVDASPAATQATPAESSTESHASSEKPEISETESPLGDATPIPETGAGQNEQTEIPAVTAASSGSEETSSSAQDSTSSSVGSESTEGPSASLDDTDDSAVVGEQDVPTTTPGLVPERISTSAPLPVHGETTVSTNEPSDDDQGQTTISAETAPDTSSVSPVTRPPTDSSSDDKQNDGGATTPTSEVSPDNDDAATDRPQSLPASTDSPIIQDVPEVSPTVPPTSAPAGADDSQSGPSTQSSAQSDETERPTEASVNDASSQPESSTSGVISGDAEPATEKPPMSDDSIPTEAPAQASEQTPTQSPTVGPGGEIIGVESVSNSPDGSENLSMIKTSTTVSPNENEVSSSAAPSDKESGVPSDEDNEISSDSVAQASSPQPPIPETTSAPVQADESSVTTQRPVAGDESSSADEPATSVSPVDIESGTSTKETSTEAASPLPDNDDSAINELIPGGQGQDPASDKVSDTPAESATNSPSESTSVSSGNDAVNDDKPTTVAPVSEDVSSSDDNAADSTTPGSLPEQPVSADEGSPSGDEPVPTSAPTEVPSSSPATADSQPDMAPTSQSPVQNDNSDDSNTVAPATVTESSVHDDKPSEAEEGGVTTSKPAGAEADDQSATEPSSIAAQPEGGISGPGAQDQGAPGQGETTPATGGIISEIKGPVVVGEAVTTAQPVDDEVSGGVTTTKPQDISGDLVVESSSSEPEMADPVVTTPISQIGSEGQTEAPVSDDVESSSTSRPDASSPVTPVEGSRPDATTVQPEQGQFDEQAAATTSPSIVEASTIVPADDSKLPSASPSESSDEPAAAATTPSVSTVEKEQQPEQSAQTTVAPVSSDGGSDADDSDEIMHPDPVYDDPPSTPQPEVSEAPAQSVSQADQQNDGVTTQKTFPGGQDDQGVSTQRPQPVEASEIPSQDDVFTTQKPIQTPEEPVSQDGVETTARPQHSEGSESGVTTQQPNITNQDDPEHSQVDGETTLAPVVGTHDDPAASQVTPGQSAPTTQTPINDEPASGDSATTQTSIKDGPTSSDSATTQIPVKDEQASSDSATTQTSIKDGPASSDIATTQTPVNDEPASGDSATTQTPVKDEPASGDSVTTQTPVKDEPASGDSVTTQRPSDVIEGVATESSSQSSDAKPKEVTTVRPDVDAPLGDDVITSTSQSPVQHSTEGDISITEQPVSMQPDSAMNMMSSTEKIEMIEGVTTGEPSVGDEDDHTTDPSAIVPGEGSCYVEGKTYRNGSSIPPTTPCHIACACKNSIVHCLLVHCPPPPNNYVDCKPIYRSGVCCPEYDCGTTEGSAMPVTVTPEPAFADNKDGVVTVTPEPATATSTEAGDTSSSSESAHTGDSSSPASAETVSQDSSEKPVTESTTDAAGVVHDQPGSEGSSEPSDLVSSTSSPSEPSSTLIPEHVESTSQDGLPQHDSHASEAPITTTSERPNDIQQIIESSSHTPEMVSGSDIVPEEEDQPSSVIPGSQYPVTTTTTVTPSSAPWPYPTSSTPPPSAMSSGACLFDGRVYMSAQQIPREDPCDFCFCFRGDIICLQQSCPPPIPGCYEEPIPGFCCPRYECPVGNGNHTTPPPLFPPSYYHNQILNGAGGNGQTGGTMTGSVPSGPGCEIQGEYFETGQVITSTSGPCLECRCGSTGMMECDPRECQPEPMLRKMIAAISSRR